MQQGTGTALVAGANRGLGLEACRQLGRLGWRVWLTAPDSVEGQQACATLRSEGLDVHFEPLDVASQESLSTLAARLEQQGVRLSALINNAGIALEGFDAHVSEYRRSCGASSRTCASACTRTRAGRARPTVFPSWA